MLEMVFIACMLMGVDGTCVAWEFKDGSSVVTGVNPDIMWGCERDYYEGDITLEMCSPIENHFGEI